MQIKSNILLKILVPVALFSSVGIGMKSCNSVSRTTADATKSSTINDLTTEELQILGIEGDTQQDTLRTLVGRIKMIQNKQDLLERTNLALVEENTKLTGSTEDVDYLIQQALSSAKQDGEQLQQKLHDEQQRLAHLIESLENKVNPFPHSEYGRSDLHSNLPIGSGIEHGAEGSPGNGTIWIEPQDGIQVDRHGKSLIDPTNITTSAGAGSFQFPTAFGNLDDNEISRQKAELDRVAKNQQGIDETELPVYTIPQNATLIGSRGMTALLGRVPIDGKVTDPYPFKILIGKENLTANGIELPDIEGAIVSGTATGDWVLSCVRGDVTSITFVFTDGTVRTVPTSARSSDGSNGRANNNGGSIGWLSDEQGTRLTFVQHMANLLPVFGRDTGTGHPGFTFFNRGGAPLTFDPLNSADRAKNAHMVLFGPTGSGKSATLNSLFAQLMAVHRPRLFIAEAGNSFGLFADHAAELELTVNKVSIKPGCNISLAPFADSHRLIEANVKLGDEAELSDRIEMDDNDDNDDERDILGELEIVARLMITGGEEKEEAKLERADRGMMREAILVAATTAFNEKRQMITQDLQTALFTFSYDESRPETRRSRAYNMGESLNVFMQGFLGELFNRPGQNWPEADVTLIDLGTLAREGYEAPLAVAYTSLVNTINNIAERDQFLDREIVFATDEAHMITTNPLLAPFVVKIVKMWRKLGAWLWLATQNLEDFPATSKKMLNMIEWWLCLVMPPEEVEEIARFKKLTTEQKAMLLSATKAQHCYTEGIVLANRIEALFRAVPPSLFLALGMTEKEEKAARKALMTEHGISELEAAKLVAKKLDIARGIIGAS